MIASALALAQDLSNDELLGRVMAAFKALPMQDRPVIAGILEREAMGRALSRATEKAFGQETHVNPHARLYVRVHNTAIDSRLFDRDEMMIADVRAMRIAGLIVGVPDVHALWKDALREAMSHADDAMLSNAEQLLRDGLAAIAEARTTAGSSEIAGVLRDAATTTRRS
jgi:hypothetical protein